jgi:archaellum component FlaC
VCNLTPLQANSEVVEQLRSDMEGLIAEVSDLSRRNDELMTSKDSDLVVIRELDVQLKEYKRKYEQAKTELRSVKGICPQHFPLHFPSFSHLNHSYIGPFPAKTQV